VSLIASLGPGVADPETEITLAGTVIVTTLDDRGKVTEVSLDTVNGIYLVSDTTAGKALLNLVGKDVKVTGVLVQGKDGKNLVSVTSYDLLGERR